MAQNIFILAEQRDGDLQKVGLELIGKAKDLAEDLGQKVVAVLLGDNIARQAETLVKYGADEVIVAEHPLLAEYMTEPYTETVHRIIKQCDPEIFLFGATSIGRDLAPRVSARVHTGLTADCTGLDINPDSKLLMMTRPAFGGNIMATIVCENHRPQMATIRPGVMKIRERDDNATGVIHRFDCGLTDKSATVVIREVVKGGHHQTDISEAKILVSVGRGVGGAENIGVFKRLSDVLGGELSSSRACVDSGWVEHSRQVGQTGKTVRPGLYLACGISGAIQHLVGMEGSDAIVAINKNENAPIFDVADMGVVGDARKLVPKLSEAIERELNQKVV